MENGIERCFVPTHNYSSDQLRIKDYIPGTLYRK